MTTILYNINEKIDVKPLIQKGNFNLIFIVLGVDMADKLTFLINIAGRLGENVICLMASSTGSPLI